MAIATKRKHYATDERGPIRIYVGYWNINHQRLIEINAQAGSRETLEAQHGQVWNTED